MSGKIAAVINVFNDSDGLEILLEDIARKVDAIIAADGRYENFPADTVLSNDGTRDLLSGMVDQVLDNEGEPWSGEAEKRNALLDAVPDDYYILRIDADERLERFQKSELIEILEENKYVKGLVKLYEDEDDRPKQMHEPILLAPKNRADWKYVNHDHLYCDGKGLHEIEGESTRNLLRIANEPYKRSDRRAIQREIYRERERS